MEDWRGLFRERFVIEENTEEQYLRKHDHRTIVEELEHFIEQELSKAREEVLKEVKNRFGGSIFLEECGGKIVRKIPPLDSWLESELSKLKQ